MKNLMFIVALVVSLFLVGPALCAGIVSQGFSERTTLSDLDAYWGWDTYVTGGGLIPAGNAWVTVEVPYNLSYSNLTFEVNREDTSFWNAYFYFRGEKSIVDSFSEMGTDNGRIEKGGVKINEYLRTGRYSDEDWVYATGSISVSPSTIISGDFLYNEYQYGDSPAIWYANYTVRGKFIADSEEEARQLGAQFVSVPEPSSFCLLSVLLLAGGTTYLYWRKKR